VWSRWHKGSECACLRSLCGLLIFCAFTLSLSLSANFEDNFKVALHFLNILVQGGGFYISGGMVSLVSCTISENSVVRSGSLPFLSFFYCTFVLSDSIVMFMHLPRITL